ncbi:MAG: LysR family transcriptional regulator [Polyangiaceae bacterium]
MVSDLETIDLTDLRTFLEVARVLSVTGAARGLKLPKSAVSKSLTRLEGRLGVRLLERSSRRVAVTRAGALLVPKAASLLAEAESLAQSLREERSEPRGLVRMTATPEMGAHFIERVVPVLAREHPGIRIAMALGYGLEDVLDPAIDVALRVGAVHDERLVAHRIGGLRWVTVASGDYLASNPVRRVSDLTQRRCLVFSATDIGAEWTFTRRDVTERVTVTSALSVAGSTALLHAARAGLGVARVVEPVAEDWLRRGELVRVLPGWASPEMPVLVVHRFGHDRIARVGAVLRAVRDLPWR